jgi:hypothetical protein
MCASHLEFENGVGTANPSLASEPVPVLVGFYQYLDRRVDDDRFIEFDQPKSMELRTTGEI